MIPLANKTSLVAYRSVNVVIGDCLSYGFSPTMSYMTVGIVGSG